MKYFLDTEFIEGTQVQSAFLNSKISKPTIDLISIGIVSEDNRHYYAISKDFNFQEAWKRYQIIPKTNLGGIGDTPTEEKEYWIRENVILPIAHFLLIRGNKEEALVPYKEWIESIKKESNWEKNWYKKSKTLFDTYGKTNETIKKEVIDFTYARDQVTPGTIVDTNIEFYAYYGAYDWVVFCWLFGKMNDLPLNFPRFYRDLKVMLDDKVKKYVGRPLQRFDNPEKFIKSYDLQKYLKVIKSNPSYPVLEQEHHALYDAIWNKNLFNFIQTL